MNIEAYNLDTLRNLVRDLQAENKKLRELLQEKNIVCSTENTFEKQSNVPDEYDPFGFHDSAIFFTYFLC